MRAAHPSCHRNDAWNKAPQNRPISPCKSQRRKGYTYKSQIAITLLERKHQMLTLQPSVRHETVPIGGNRHRGILGMTEIFRQSMAQVLYKTIGQTVPRHQSQHNHTKTKLFIAKCSRKRPHSREFRLSYFFLPQKKGNKALFFILLLRAPCKFSVCRHPACIYSFSPAISITLYCANASPIDAAELLIFFRYKSL